MVTANAASRLIQHYVDNSRALPWRSPRGEPNAAPYIVWLSEVMLQQTTVATVVPRFERFLARWPTVEALAAASDEDVLTEWAGLGYYARARNLIACAREVARRGAFPSTAAELKGLPGVGTYTAAAIAAIAFGEAAPAVDTNVQRVVSRVLGFREPNRDAIERYVRELMLERRPGDVVQALMDLGATVCRPKQPRCEACPLRRDCAASASGAPEAFPAPRARVGRPNRFGVAWWIERDRHVWLVRRPSRGLLGGMPALPGSEWTEAEFQVARPLGTLRHVFTHFSLELIIEERLEPIGDGWWQPLAAIDEAGLPTLYRKAIRIALGRNERIAA